MTREQYLEIRRAGDLPSLFRYFYSVYVEATDKPVPFQMFYITFKQWLQSDMFNTPDYWSALDTKYELNFVYSTTDKQPQNIIYIY